MKLPEILQADMQPKRILHPSRVSVDLSKSSVSSASIETRVDDGVEFGDFVKIYYPNGYFGIFRACTPENNYDTGKATIAFDHGVKTLSDNIVNVGDTTDSDGVSQATYFEGNVKTVFNRILGYQKKEYWVLGKVECTDTIKVEVAYDNMLTLMNTAMEQIVDYYIMYDQSDFPWRIHILKHPEKVAGEGRLSRNLTTAKVKYDDSELYTRVWCEQLSTTNKYMDASTTSKFGIREKEYNLSDDYTASEINKLCKNYLKNHSQPKITVTMDGADFYRMTGQPLDRVVLCDLYRLALPKWDIVIEEQITALNYPDLISRPNAVTITLGRESYDLSIFVASNSSSTSTSSSSSKKKSSSTVRHVYEKLHKEEVVTEGHSKVLHEAGIEYDSDGVMIYAKQTGMNTNSALVKNTTKFYVKANNGSPDYGNIPQGAVIYVEESGATWSKVNYGGKTGYVHTSDIQIGVSSIAGAFKVTAERLTSDYTNAVAGVESHITQTASEIRTEVKSKTEGLESSINQTAGEITAEVKRAKSAETTLAGRLDIKDTEVSLLVGETDNREVQYFNTEAEILAKTSGSSRYLYYARDTKKYYEWKNGAWSECGGPGSYINAGGIVSAINDDGTYDTLIKGDRIWVGTNHQTIADLDLPDWMDTTEGLIAEKATIVSLNALTARVGSLESDSIKTSELSAKIAALDGVSAKSLNVTNNIVSTIGYVMAPNFYIGVASNAKLLNNAVQSIVLSGPVNNVYTLKSVNFDGNETQIGTFSRATTLTGAWSSGRFTVSASPQSKSYYTDIFQGTATLSGNAYTVPIKAYLDGNTQTEYDTGRSVYIDATARYEAGYDAVSAPSVSISPIASEYATQGVSGTASIANTTGGNSRSTSISLSLEKSTYRNSPYASTDDNCVNVKNGNQVVARISTQSVYNNGYRAGWNAARGKVSRTGNVIYRPKQKTTADTTDPGTEVFKTASVNLDVGEAWGKAKVYRGYKTPGSSGIVYDSTAQYGIDLEIITVNNTVYYAKADDGYWGWSQEPSATIEWT